MAAHIPAVCHSSEDLFNYSGMARGKTKMVRIADEKVLKSTFKKRKNGLIKKLHELTILCDIVSCVIIYSPIIGGRPPEIFTWPADQEKVRAAIRMYQDKEEHKQKTAGLCDFLKNRRTLDMSDHHHHHHQVNNMPMSGASFFERRGTPAERVLAYLNWVDARIKAVDERIELVENSGNMMLFGSDHCHNVVFDDDDKMMVMPVNHEEGNFGYYGNFSQFDPYMYDHSQTMCVRGGAYTNNPLYLNLVPETSHQNAISGYQQFQTPNQLCLYDPYLLGMEQSNVTLAISINRGLQYQQQQQEEEEEEEHHYETTQTQPQCHFLMSCKTDDLTQQRPYLEDWSSPDAASSNYSSSSSNQFNRTAAAAPAAALDDPVGYFLNAAEFTDEIQPLEYAYAARENILSKNGV